jgi:hypothetical protein
MIATHLRNMFMPATQGEEMTGENPFGFCSES